MRRIDEYLATIDTIYPDGYSRETLFRSSGDMLAPAPMPRSRSGLMGIVDGWKNWSARRSGRLALREMSADQLRDLGLTRAEARREASKSWLLWW